VTLSLGEKKSLVSSVSQKIADSDVLILMNYQGLAVEELNSLRSKSRAEGLVVKVVPNRLMQRALDGTKFDNLKSYCKGQLITMFANDNASIGARLLVDFVKGQDKLKIVSFSLEGQIFSGSDIKTLANMPTRFEAIAKVAVLMKMPMVNLARSLNDLPSRLARALVGIKNKK